MKRIVKEYSNWVLIETIFGYKEGINKQELGYIKQTVKPDRKPHKNGWKWEIKE